MHHPQCAGPAAADRTTTIHHWQLRDLISAAENEHEFYCVDEQQVFTYNVKTKEVCVAQ
jgi:hypothetical protein